MTQFAYFAAKSVDEAVALLAKHSGAKPMAGGTDLLVQMRSGRITPAALIDIKRIPEMIGVKRRGGGFAIGAGTPCTALAKDLALAAAWPGVVEAANLIGSVQIRNRATIAGNLCNASPAADSVPALVAAEARCVIAGPGGRREVPVSDIPSGPGRTILSPGEFIVEILLAARGEHGGDAYLRAIPRTEMDIAVVGVGVNLVCDRDGVCRQARIALGAVAPTVVLAGEASAALIGTRLEDAALATMEEAVRAVCKPISDKRGPAEYRTAIAGVLAKRAALAAYARARRAT
jgi:carbon-monoxide dehydrogenase medium subunit